MSGPGTPEPNAKRLGEIVARIRTERGLSRSKLVRQMLKYVPATSSLQVSESLLRDIEEGNKVKTTREVLEVLFRALPCKPVERIEILLAADRNIMADADGSVSEDDELLLYAIAYIKNHPIARQLLKSLRKGEKAANLTPRDIDRMMLTIFQSIVEVSSVSTSINNQPTDDSSSMTF
jgi:hypothetical protein